ncbi:MAG: ribonuclease HII [Acidimicrobiia bacterium]|nr:ribonuclease HII [Acidimicrobiia bacterium]
MSSLTHDATVRPAQPGTLRSALKRRSPGLAFEKKLWDQGVDVVVGVDEVGRGAWAGPLTVGALVVPRERRIYKIRDSKMLTEPERELMYRRIVDWAEAWSVGHASHQECDELGMSDAQRLAARRAIDGLGLPAEKVLVDGNWDFVGGATRIVRGDAISLSIAAASIVAKVTRDRIMRRWAEDHPFWNFADNKGYPCPHHRTALQGYGPSAIHRRSWVFMDSLIWTGLPRHHRPDPNQPELPF